jgi:glycosyltransferase involved in cell wall biosynthesis
MINDRNIPLVSIIVITYNSSKYVLETLDSIKNQTYRNFELIISDDCSTDDTIEVIQKWINYNNGLSFEVKLIESKINTGIPSNVNRGMDKATGEWVKIIAGDDLLLSDCIASNMDFVESSSAQFIFSKPVYINDLSEDIEDNNKFDYSFYSLESNQQYVFLLTRDNPINPPSLFFNMKTAEKIGGFDEKFKVEDLPFYLNVTKNGYKLFLLNKYTIKYRVHDTSYSQRYKGIKGVSELEKYKVKNILKTHISWSLFLKHPLVVLDYFNRLLFINSVIFFGNEIETRKKLLFLRYLSPLNFYNFMYKLKLKL